MELSSPPARASSPRCHPGGTVVLDSWPPGPREGTSGVYAARQAVLWQSKQTHSLCKPLSLSAWEREINGKDSLASRTCQDPDSTWPQTSASCFQASISYQETRMPCWGTHAAPDARCAA